MKSDTCRAKLEGKRGVYCRSDGTEKLSCTRSGILLAANAVHLTVMLCDLAYLSSDQAVLRCSEPSVSVPQADRPRLNCSTQGMSDQLLVRLTKQNSSREMYSHTRHKATIKNTIAFDIVSSSGVRRGPENNKISPLTPDEDCVESACVFNCSLCVVV